MNCDEVRAVLNSYVNGDLDAGLRRLVDEHLLHCPSCREELSIEIGKATGVLDASPLILSHRIREYLDGGTERGLSAIQGDIQQYGAREINVDDDADASALMAEEAPIVRVANTIIEQAIRDSASEIKVEPENDGVGIYYCIRGDWHQEMEIPKYIYAPLIARLKDMGGLDKALSSVPQTGRATVRREGTNVTLRISCTPTEHGDMVVIGLEEAGEKGAAG